MSAQEIYQINAPCNHSGIQTNIGTTTLISEECIVTHLSHFW